MIPALFVIGGLCFSAGILAAAWQITATEETTVALGDAPDCGCTDCTEDQPVDYYLADHPGWRYLAAAVNAERTPLFDQVLEESDWRAWAQEMGA